MKDQDLLALFAKAQSDLNFPKSPTKGNAKLQDISNETMGRIALIHTLAASETGASPEFARLAGHYMDLVREFETSNG